MSLLLELVGHLVFWALEVFVIGFWVWMLGAGVLGLAKDFSQWLPKWDRG